MSLLEVLPVVKSAERGITPPPDRAGFDPATAASHQCAGFDPAMAGKQAECDGGEVIAGTHLVSRQEFAGTLTGDFVESGDPPWRWYLVGDLNRAPDGYAHNTVWCESGSLFVVEGGRPSPGVESAPCYHSVGKSDHRRAPGDQRQGNSLARKGRREAILDAAMDLFARRGYGGVAIQEIADAAETHKTTLLYQFQSKESLHEAVLDRAINPVIEMMHDFLANGFTPDRLAWYLDELHRFLRDNPSIPRLMMRELLEGGEYGDSYADRFATLFEPAQKRLAEAERAGMIAHVEPAFFVHDLHVQIMTYFCHGTLLERMMRTDPYSVEALIVRRNYLVDQIVRQQRPAGLHGLDPIPEPAARSASGNSSARTTPAKAAPARSGSRTASPARSPSRNASPGKGRTKESAT